MKHRILHSVNLRDHLADYAPKLGVALSELTTAFDWMCAHNVAFEEVGRGGVTNSYIAYVNIERIEQLDLGKRATGKRRPA